MRWKWASGNCKFRRIRIVRCAAREPPIRSTGLSTSMRARCLLLPERISRRRGTRQAERGGRGQFKPPSASFVFGRRKERKGGSGSYLPTVRRTDIGMVFRLVCLNVGAIESLFYHL